MLIMLVSFKYLSFQRGSLCPCIGLINCPVGMFYRNFAKELQVFDFLA